MAAAESSRLIELDDEIEGDRQGDPDFVFRRVGESVPLKADDSAFDLSDPPSKPLAVSERLGALFLAHSEGFLVARMKDVIQTAKEIKEKGEGPCIQELSVADVQIGKVSILAVSTDCLTLAAVVGGDIHFYSVSSLLNKEQKPSFSCSCDESPIIKDFKWRKSGERSFLVLSSCSLLYYGNLKDKLRNVADNIDAVDWSVEGDLVVVAKGNTLTILSSDFKEQLSMCLLFKSCPINGDMGCIIKVDSINWVRDDSIIVGCIGVDKGGKEDGYFVQVIKSKETGFTESSHMPIVYSFPSLFEGISNDILPFGAGPYLLSGYLDRWELILASNKKAVDDHFQLLGWDRTNNSSEVLLLDIQYDQFPTIDLQENGDDNVILGLGIDRISLYDKVPVQVGSDLEERTPYCILLCLTCEGKLIMFHSVRISEPKGLCQTSLPSLHDNNSVHEASAGANSNELPTTMSRSKVDVVVSDDKLGHIISEGPNLSIGKGRTSFGSIDTSKLFDSREHTSGTSAGQIPKSNQLPFDLSHNQISDFTLKANSNSGSQQISFSSSGIDTDTALVAGEVSTDASATIQTNANRITKSRDMVKGPVSICTAGAIFGSQSIKYSANDVSVAKPSTSSFSTSIVNDIQGKPEIDKGFLTRQTSSTVNHLSAGHPFSLTDSVRKSSTLMFSSNKAPLSDGLATSGTRSISAEPVTAVFTSPILTQEASLPAKSAFFSGQHMHPNNRSFKSSQVLNSEQEMSKEFYNIKDMVKELDILLSSIEKEGGFRDACTVFQKTSVVALEEDLGNIFEMSRRCKAKLAERLLAIQHLQNKMLQASARQVYMEGIVKQASNEQYWDIWNRQKLSPEFELKRQKIFNAKQDLTNQLIELEKHFNALEIKRFGESGRISAGRGASSSSLEPARQNLSLHAIYNTVNSQLTAAQKLSECLSSQMAKLNIESPIAKRQNLAKELFESIGLTHGPSNYQTPFVKKHGINPDQIKGVLFSPSNDCSTKNMPSISKSAGAEASRRRRDSLDRSLSSFEPQKTTVKRVLQEGHVGTTADKPLRTMEAFNSQIKGLSVVQTRSNETPASSHSFINKFQLDDYLKDKGLEKFSKQSSESAPKSVFKWAKDLPDFDSVESRSQPVPVLNRSIEPSSSMLSSPSHLNSVQFNSKKTSGSVDMPVNQATQFGSKQSSSTMKTATLSKTSGMQFESPIISQTFSEVSSISSPTRNKLISRNQASEQLNFKNAGGPTGALLSSTKQPTTFPHSQPAISNGTNISHLASTFASPSTSLSQNTDRLDGMENKNQQTEFQNALSQESVSIAPFPILSASAISSTVSLPITPSVSPTSLSPVADGVSQFNNKPTGDTDRAASVSPVTSAASDQSAFSSGLLPSQNSPTSAYSPFKSAELKPFTSQSLGVSSGTKPTRAEAPLSVDPVSQSEVSSKLEPAVSLAPVKEVSVGLFSRKEPNLLPSNTSTTSIVLNTQHELPSTLAPTTIATMNEKDEVVDINSSLEDEMEEEAPDTSVLNLGSLGGFGLGSTPPSAPKPNPFGGSLFGTTASSATFQLSHTTSPGELFRPPSLNLPSAQQVQQTQPVHSSNTSGGFSGFGQAAQLGSGQQALGSVLGSFGQSRQLGSGMAGFGFASGGFSTGGFSAPANSGGFASAGGFANAATGSGFSIASSGGGFAGTPKVGGFAAVASSGGGFAAAATGGGFAAVASGSGGFAAAASAGGGFGGAGQGGGFAAASSAAGGFGGAGLGVGFAGSGLGGGFAGSTSTGAGGFGAFNSSQGGGFSAFGSSNSSGTGRPPAALLTQMRK